MAIKTCYLVTKQLRHSTNLISNPIQYPSYTQNRHHKSTLSMFLIYTRQFADYWIKCLPAVSLPRLWPSQSSCRNLNSLQTNSASCRFFSPGLCSELIPRPSALLVLSNASRSRTLKKMMKTRLLNYFPHLSCSCFNTFGGLLFCTTLYFCKNTKPKTFRKALLCPTKQRWNVISIQYCYTRSELSVCIPQMNTVSLTVCEW